MTTTTSLMTPPRRGPQEIRAMLVVPYWLTNNLDPVIAADPVFMEASQLDGLYPSRTYRYARPGDFVGRIRKKDAPSVVVDFHISPHHAYWQDCQWKVRLVDFAKVAKVLV